MTESAILPDMPAALRDAFLASAKEGATCPLPPERTTQFLREAPAHASALLVLGAAEQAWRVKAAYVDYWREILSTADRFESFLDNDVYQDMFARDDGPTMLYDLLRTATASECALLDALQPTWSQYKARRKSSELATGTLALYIDAVLDLSYGRHAEWAALAEEMWDDWVRDQDILDDPYWRGLRSLASRDQGAFSLELQKLQDETETALRAAMLVRGRVQWSWSLLTRCDVVSLVRIARSTTGFNLPDVVPGWAERYWAATRAPLDGAG